MPFPLSIREEALVRSGRRCCVCHDFVGRAINVHHIIQEADGGANKLENAIVLCLRCHSEAGHFNPRHPIGTKYAPSELVKHRDQLWAAVANGNVGTTHNSLAVSWRRIFLSSDLHTHRLLLTLQNGTEASIAQWKLNLFLPRCVPVRTDGICSLGEKTVDGDRYRVFELSGGPAYAGEGVELLGMQAPFLEYDVNHGVYHETRDVPSELKWRVYLATGRPIEGSRPWKEMHQY